MQIDKFTKACLLAITILLTILVVRPVLEAKESYAAAKRVEYKVIRTPDDLRGPALQETLNKNGSEGWELVFMDPSAESSPVAVFKR